MKRSRRPPPPPAVSPPGLPPDGPAEPSRTKEATGTQPERRRRLSPVWIPVAASSLLWFALFLTVPFGRQDFPLNDDWAYARGAFAFARGDGIHYFGWTSVPLIGQWLWAWPFIKILGPTNAALRLSTVVLSLLGTVAFYRLLRDDAGLSPRRAAFGASTLALNPLFLVCSGTFMTDVPALSFGLISLALATRALKTGHLLLWIAAAVVGALGGLTRQTALAAPLAAAIALLSFPAYRRPRFLYLAVMAAPLILGIAANQWLAQRPDIVHQGMSARLPEPGDLLRGPFMIVIYLGLAVLPILLLSPMLVRRRALFLASFTVLLLGAVYLVLTRRQMFPYLGNLITVFGQLTLGVELVGKRDILIPVQASLALTLAACLGGAALIARSVHGFRSGAVSLSRVLQSPLLLYSGMHFAFLFLISRFFDRYLLSVLPAAIFACLVVIPPSASTTPAAAAAEPEQPPIRLEPLAGIAALALWAFLGAGLMHDWLAWNAARYELGKRAIARGIAVADLEGGLEWDGWHSPEGAAPLPPGPLAAREGLALAMSKTLFPYLTGRYALSFSPLRGTRIRDAEPYRLWLLPGRREFVLLELVPELIEGEAVQETAPLAPNR